MEENPWPDLQVFLSLPQNPLHKNCKMKGRVWDMKLTSKLCTHIKQEGGGCEIQKRKKIFKVNIWICIWQLAVSLNLQVSTGKFLCFDFICLLKSNQPLCYQKSTIVLVYSHLTQMFFFFYIRIQKSNNYMRSLHLWNEHYFCLVIHGISSIMSLVGSCLRYKSFSGNIEIKRNG